MMAKTQDNDGVELILLGGDADVLAHGEDVADREIGIELAEDFLNRKGERFDIDIGVSSRGKSAAASIAREQRNIVGGPSWLRDHPARIADDANDFVVCTQVASS